MYLSIIQFSSQAIKADFDNVCYGRSLLIVTSYILLSTVLIYITLLSINAQKTWLVIKDPAWNFKHT
jgi:hypothetical protein